MWDFSFLLGREVVFSLGIEKAQGCEAVQRGELWWRRPVICSISVICFTKLKHGGLPSDL